MKAFLDLLQSAKEVFKKALLKIGKVQIYILLAIIFNENTTKEFVQKLHISIGYGFVINK